MLIRKTRLSRLRPAHGVKLLRGRLERMVAGGAVGSLLSGYAWESIGPPGFVSPPRVLADQREFRRCRRLDPSKTRIALPCAVYVVQKQHVGREPRFGEARSASTFLSRKHASLARARKSMASIT